MSTDAELATRLAVEAGQLLVALRDYAAERRMPSWQLMDTGDLASHRFLLDALREASDDEATLAASGLVGMDNDSVGLTEEIEQILDSVGISTLENNLFNFGVDPANPMDESTLPFLEALAINEAVDLGKRYGSEESGAFVNGILDKISEISLKKKGKTSKYWTHFAAQKRNCKQS